MEKEGIMTYKGYNTAKFEDIYFLKDENSTPLQILQLYIYSLVEGGMCFIVIPYGELFYKDGLALNGVRKLLLDKINITDIIVCPGGLFTYTGTKVCMLIFEKCSTGTKAIRFGRYDFNTSDTKDKKRFLKYYRHYSTVKKEDILKEPINSLYHMDYLHDEHAQTLIDSGKIKECEWIPFGDVFDFIKGELQSSKVEEVDDSELFDGINYIKFITGAKDDTWKTILKREDSFCTGENVFISENGNGNSRPVKYYDGACNYSNLVSLLKCKLKYDNKINKKYIYYYLTKLQPYIEEHYQKGSCNQSLDVKNFNRMKIPIPSLDVQRAYVNAISDAVSRSMNIENFDAKLSKLSYIETLSNTIRTTDVKELFELALKKQIKLPETKWVPFGDVFDLVKGELQSSKVEEDENGDGVLINWANSDNYKKINKNICTNNGENIFITQMIATCVASFIRIKYYNGLSTHTDLMSILKINDTYKSKINMKYIYYYLKSIEKYIENTYFKGCLQESLDVKNFNRMKIPIPPIEAQNEIVAEINEVESIAERWKRDIEYLKNKKGNRMLDILNLDTPE
jgi:restriction endonuclease S subunit